MCLVALFPKKSTDMAVLIPQSQICSQLGGQGQDQGSSRSHPSRLLPAPPTAPGGASARSITHNYEIISNTKLPQAKSISPRGLTHLRLLNTKKWWSCALMFQVKPHEFKDIHENTTGVYQRLTVREKKHRPGSSALLSHSFIVLPWNTSPFLFRRPLTAVDGLEVAAYMRGPWASVKSKGAQTISPLTA